MAITIPRAIQLFQYSFTGQGRYGLAQLASQVTQRLWQLHGQSEIGIVEILDPDDEDDTTTLGDWQADRPGHDLRVNRAYINSLPEGQQLGAVSLILVHEAVHSVLNYRKLNEEVRARRLEVTYYRELSTLGVLDETTDPPPPGGRTVTVYLQGDTFPGHRRQLRWLEKDQLIDYVVSYLSTYRRHLRAGWIRDNIHRWRGSASDGIHNRWATTKGHYIRVLADRRRSEYTDLILDIMESISESGHWTEMLRVAGPLRTLQIALDPTNLYLPRIGALQRRWGTQLIE
jgi:hypothetical protein